MQHENVIFYLLIINHVFKYKSRVLCEVIHLREPSVMPQGRPKQGNRMRYIHVIIKEVTHGRWEQATKRLVTKTDDSLTNYLLDLYLNDSPSLPRSNQQCNIEATRYASFSVSVSLIHTMLILNSQHEQVNEAEGDIPLR